MEPNWMNLPQEYNTEKSKFVILPIAYEKNVTFGIGASKGPAEIIKASKHLEYYDDQFDCEPFLQGIKLLDQLELNDKNPKEMVSEISRTIENQKGKFMISLGGDHAVTIGIVKGLEKYHQNFSIIQFDAHADFRDSWNGSSLNHACVSRQISKKHELLNIGVRSMDIDEKKLIEKEKNVHLIPTYNFSLEKIEKILPKLKNKVYITIDIDSLDPSFIRNTGTPEPGGLTWNNLIESLKLIFRNKEVIGADIVEFSPKHDFEPEAYALAKLTYKIMAMQQTYK
jgi:agmatinase